MGHTFAVLLLILFTASPAVAARLPLGTFTPTAATDPKCPTGFTCTGFTVSCSGVAEDAPGFVAFADATASRRGMVVFFTGGSGQSWWSDSSRLITYLDELRALGFAVMQVRWATNWLNSSPGNEAGTAHLGCRPATVIRHIYDTSYLPMNLSPGLGECGFCITGNSGGSTQVSYALSHSGLEGILDGVFPTGGPPHSVLTKSCLPNKGYTYRLDTRQFLDRGFGFFDGNGPCARQDPSFVPRWESESVATGGDDYHHPRTRIHFVFGENDREMRTVAGDYVARLTEERTPFLTVTIAEKTGHSIASTPQGLAALKAAILGRIEGGRRRAVRK